MVENITRTLGSASLVQLSRTYTFRKFLSALIIFCNLIHPELNPADLIESFVTGNSPPVADLVAVQHEVQESEDSWMRVCDSNV